MYPHPKSPNPLESFDMSLWLVCCSSLCLKPSPWLMEKARRDLGWLPSVCHQQAIGGFTLAEVLISLAILGVIAVFTIPKILISVQTQQYNVQAKEAAAMVSAAYQKYKLSGMADANTKLENLTPYMNYVSMDTVGTIDYLYSYPLLSINCTHCFVLHSGGKLNFYNYQFTGTTSTNAIRFHYDPDGIVTDSTTVSPGRSIAFYLFYDGRLQTEGTVPAGTVTSFGQLPTSYPRPQNDPPYLQW